MKSLYEGLQEIAETFKDTVPISYNLLPVIRYSPVNEIPSLNGDDQTHNWFSYWQVDLYDHTDNEEMKKEIKDLCNEEFWRITNIQETTEEGKKRYIFDIQIEE